jgi:cytochrome P450
MRSQTLHNLHKKYGPVVRIGPDQVAFSTKQAMRDIYGPNTNYAKAPAYGAFGRKSLFTMRVKEEHRERQKRIAHVFGPASVAQIEPIVTEQVTKFLKCVESRLDQPMDMMLWFWMLALDVTSKLKKFYSYPILRELQNEKFNQHR